MHIRIHEHPKERATDRGASEEEIIDTLRNGNLTIAKGKRLAKEKIYSFNEDWNGKPYEEKQVKVIYIN